MSLHLFHDRSLGAHIVFGMSRDGSGWINGERINGLFHLLIHGVFLVVLVVIGRYIVVKVHPLIRSPLIPALRCRLLDVYLDILQVAIPWAICKPVAAMEGLAGSSHDGRIYDEEAQLATEMAAYNTESQAFTTELREFHSEQTQCNTVLHELRQFQKAFCCDRVDQSVWDHRKSWNSWVGHYKSKQSHELRAKYKNWVPHAKRQPNKDRLVGSHPNGYSWLINGGCYENHVETVRPGSQPILQVDSDGLRSNRLKNLKDRAVRIP